VDRAAYEELTRAARFETYAAAAGDGGVVLLGHNRDDQRGKQPVDALSGENFKPLELGQIEVVSANFWTDRFLSAHSF